MSSQWEISRGPNITSSDLSLSLGRVVSDVWANQLWCQPLLSDQHYLRGSKARPIMWVPMVYRHMIVFIRSRQPADHHIVKGCINNKQYPSRDLSQKEIVHIKHSGPEDFYFTIATTALRHKTCPVGPDPQRKNEALIMLQVSNQSWDWQDHK